MLGLLQYFVFLLLLSCDVNRWWGRVFCLLLCNAFQTYDKILIAACKLAISVQYWIQLKMCGLAQTTQIEHCTFSRVQKQQTQVTVC